MQKKTLFMAFLCLVTSASYAQQSLTKELALNLSKMPMQCIGQEFPNKTGHIINSQHEVPLSPRDLHPVFYGCLDWHSSVHGHWMLVHLLKTQPDLPNRNAIECLLENSFIDEKMKGEAAYFNQFERTKTYERTYGWAWLLKLDEELGTWDAPIGKKWHRALQPLTQQIVELWKTYLPKQTYPNRTGVHPNSAFALGFAIDWARATADAQFEQALIDKAKNFYLSDEKTPAYLEPDGSDFFSPSLEIADLMRRILSRKDFAAWLDCFYEERSIRTISEIPIVSDLNDYYTVHLVGLSLSRAWCMKSIAQSLPENHTWKAHFSVTAEKLLINALPTIFEGNYGGDHWLASFAIYALDEK